MSKTNYLENKVLDHALGTTSYTAPSAVYVGLFTADPTDTGATTDEISGNGYSRQTITFDAASNGSATGPATNAGAVEFTASGGNWGTITDFGIFDGTGASANMLYKGTLSSQKTVTDGDSIRFAEGSITITED